jgi:RNA polymerase sigma-70 factor (ECF subfamily)
MPPTLDELVAKHHAAVHAYVRLHAGAALRTAESCSDITQEVALKALAARDRFEFRGEREFRSWMIQTTKFVLEDRRKRFRAAARNPERAVPIDEQLLMSYRSFWTPSREAIAREELARVELAFERLSEEHREVISLVRVWGLGYREVAKLMGRSEDAVRMLLCRGLARLAGEMAGARPGVHQA